MVVISKIKALRDGFFRNASALLDNVKTWGQEQIQSYRSRLKGWKMKFSDSRPSSTDVVIRQSWNFAAIFLLVLLAAALFIVWSRWPIFGVTLGLENQHHLPEEKPGIGELPQFEQGDLDEAVNSSFPSETCVPPLISPEKETATELDISEMDSAGEGSVTAGKNEDEIKESNQETRENVHSELTAEQIIPVISNGSGYCVECKRYQVKGRFTHYWPNTYPSEYKKIAGSNLVTTMNCMEYNLVTYECESSMASDLPWKAFIGLAAACPFEYPYGTRVIIPALGREYICLDRGTMICARGLCEFDILAEGIAFDGEIFETFIEVPGW